MKKRLKDFFYFKKKQVVISNDLVGKVDENELFIDFISKQCNGFEGKRVLEVGADQEGVLLKIIASKHKADEAIGINLVTEKNVLLENCMVLNGDIRKTKFADDYFDVIISSSVFEHIQNFDQAIKEMYRVLKPGGLLYSHFGPIWSTSYGHHLWMDFDSKSYNYWNFELPPFSHLLMSKEEMFEYCFQKTNNKDLSNSIVSFVFESDAQNRLMYEDYENIVKNSLFEIVFFKGYDHPILSKKYTSSNFLPEMSLLKEKYLDFNNFQYDGITLLLKK